ncbi:meiotic recombination protein REC8 homolog [Dendropsophus ebraccatus]|uniref:meiotic recombination protein REC8 homolog n=1 Tax=Dendropsophus ebraccatus TaxID=150705 RepID=UPI003831708E
MFYYPNVLQRHTGCFSTIWLAATKGSRIVKREYLKVNVIKTCQKIVQYILQQVPPPYHGCPIPRLSLYLSAQLSYGVVCVYHRQCDLLIEEVKTTVERLCKAERQAKIDLMHTEQPLLVPDNLMRMQMLEDAPDPFFGMMEISPELPEPTMIPQLSMLLEISGPEIVRVEKTPTRRRRASRTEDTSHLASPELITMKEVEPAPLPPTEFGQDLPEVSAHDFDLLLSEIPPFPEIETLPGPRKRRISGEPDTREHPREVRPRELKRERDTISEVEAEGEKHLEETAIEADRERRELHNMEKEIEQLKEERRKSELQWEHERERERKEVLDREKQYQKELKKEMESLKKAIKELKHLRSSGATDQLLLEKEKQIRNLKELQKEKQCQWEAEALKQQLKEKEREIEHLKELEEERKRIREAEQEIARLKKAMAEKQPEESGMEPDRKMRKEEERVDEKRKSETEGSPVRSSPRSGLPSELLSEHEAAALLDEVTGQPITFFPESGLEIQLPEPASPPVTPRLSSPQLVLPEVPLEAGHLPRVRRPVRKTGLIIDKDTQIGRKVMQQQTSDPLIYTQPVVPVTIPSIKLRTPASLLDAPTYQTFMAPELIELWSRCAFSEPMQYIQEREEEVSEPEEVRAATESAVSIMLSSEVSLEVSEEERSRPIVLLPEEGRSLSGHEDRVLPMVSEMPEMIVELPETEEVLLSDMQRELHSEIDSAGQSEFLSLVPHSLSRLLVSRFFFSCLVLSTQDVICPEQNEPYGPIKITPGRKYSQG